MAIIRYYHYIFEETKIGYEVYNTRNGNRYLVNKTDKNGWECTCAGRIIGNSKYCKHIRHVKKVFGIKED